MNKIVDFGQTKSDIWAVAAWLFSPYIYLTATTIPNRTGL